MTSPPPVQTRMLDARGLVTLPWLMYFQSARTSFTDRGDPVVPDKAMPNYIPGAWTDWDLKDIVPTGVTSVLLRAQVLSVSAAFEFAFRKKGHTAGVNVSHLSGVANQLALADLIVACDSDRIIQYYISPGSFATVFVTVAGWWK